VRPVRHRTNRWGISRQPQNAILFQQHNLIENKKSPDQIRALLVFFAD
jgi:chemotaxis methyl-accepting protein methylase